jgi:hypothetical protein
MNHHQKQAASNLYDQVRALPGVYSVGMSLDGTELHVFVQPGTEVGKIPASVGKFRVVAHEVDFK